MSPKCSPYASSTVILSGYYSEQLHNMLARQTPCHQIELKLNLMGLTIPARCMSCRQVHVMAGFHSTQSRY